ncbi:PREDICTED: cation/H(+) antiporter 15 [Tarenaya hassleriana]|uniref:cation/H(+) antiporter 15 n=1 Tax=Tarenaya hassleriana TaxID=28532 RepID=UPI00053C8376|nr:PREDICTED: cation/H(+) antiporter 15 [Tarenaya hassleriana]
MAAVTKAMPFDDSDSSIICYAPSMITTNGVWQGDNPLDFSLPLFILQLTLVVLTTRIFVYILRPFRQPRVIAEILGGIVLGPSVLGRNKKFANMIFPQRSVIVLETMANVGLLYFLFLVGVEMDITVVRRTGKRALTIAVGGMVIPFLLGCGFSFIIRKENDHLSQGTYILFLGVALSVTAFPVLARILAELKLINTDLGRLAMSSALINDMFAWVLLALAIALSENDNLASLWVLLSSAAFIAICFFVVRPGISWIIRKTPEGENFSDFHICLILTGVMISGFITDAIGTHSVFGAFLFGLVIPNGPLGLTLIEKLEDFVSGLLLPLFFAISGLKTDISAIKGPVTWGALLLMILLACVGKVAGTVVAAFFHDMPIREGVTLGLLLNTKGLIEMIVLNVGKDQKVLDDEIFATMVMVAVIMTGIITPIATIVYRPTKRFVPYKRRTIQKMKPDSEFRVLVCIHTPRNVPTIINLFEASHPTRRSPICIYVLHLVELTGRASAMLIVHNTRKSGRPALNRTQAQSDHIINAFENYEQHAAYVAVQPLTAISPYNTMHEDIANLAEDKRVSFIIIPFHKQQTVDGGMEATNPAYRLVNQNLLENAPCSVGILVDRGLNGGTRLASSTISLQVAVLFLAGPDDREALAYAWRMSEHPGITLTVMRFIPGEDVALPSSARATHHSDSKMLRIDMDFGKEMELDDEYLNVFRTANADYEGITYIEKVVNNGEETVAAIRSMDSSHDLFIVGRRRGIPCPLTAGLTDWSECPELGAIGDLLASSDFAATVSVLVVQQYAGSWQQEEDIDLPDSPRNSDEHISKETQQHSKGGYIPNSPH